MSYINGDAEVVIRGVRCPKINHFPRHLRDLNMNSYFSPGRLFWLNSISVFRDQLYSRIRDEYGTNSQKYLFFYCSLINRIYIRGLGPCELYYMVSESEMVEIGVLLSSPSVEALSGCVESVIRLHEVNSVLGL